MKKVTVLFRTLVLGVSILAANVFAASYLIQVESPQYYGQIFGAFWNNGSINNVPAGANFEWEISAGGGGYSHILIGGGGLNVNQSVGGGGDAYDVGSTSYADTISYQLSASTGGYPDNAMALLYVGW